MRDSAPVERFQVVKSFPPAGGKVLVRIRAIVAARGRMRDGMLRAFFRVRSAPPAAAGTRMIPAIGAAGDGRPAVLEGEAHLPPGLYEVRPERGTAPGVRFQVRGVDDPIRFFCRHRGREPSYSEYDIVLSPQRRVLGGVFVTRKSVCCRRDVLRYMTRAENPFDLVLVEPLHDTVHLRMGDAPRIARAGEYLLVDPSLSSALDPATPFPAEYRAVAFAQEGLRQARDLLDLDRGMGAFGFDPRPRRVTPALRQALDAFARAALRQGALGGEWDARLAHQRLLLFLLNTHPSRLKSAWDSRVRGDPADPRLLKAVRHLRDHLAEPFNVRETARAACVSPPHLRYLFRRMLGTSPVHYLQRLRVEAAKKMLASSDIKLEAVARAVGYADLSSLRRIFLRHAKKTPKSFA